MVTPKSAHFFHKLLKKGRILISQLSIQVLLLKYDMDTFLLPVLPIPNVVFFAHTSLPVYIIEPIYVQMIKDCISENRSIAISKAQAYDHLSTQGRFKPSIICGMGKPVILEEAPDGSLKVLIKGTGRVKLLSIEQNLPYLIYKAEIYTDKKESEHFYGPQIENLKNLLDNWLELNVTDSFERESFSRSLITIYHVVDYICMFLVHDADLRQLLLENNSMFERIQLLSSLFEDPNQFEERSIVVNAIKHYEEIENTSRIAH
ncbi:hypothetical protein A9Q84_07740 [Halobacteriovorax marinus]|uniref:Lon N-terminal domain-containing protein n=1 Tax=Halobacteriovorax marinus TaxID=97084 RepID=A0A1Y5F9R0_9BACT|nr:hypothetical protein A9Q84_07740 [Halobacteriovorax marinus]